MDEATRAASPPATLWRRRLGVLAQRNFGLFWFGLVLSNTGTWMQLTAQGWLVYELSDSALTLGALGGVRAVPMIVLPFFGGVVADRMDRRRLLFITQSGAAVTALVLAFLTVTGVIEVWQILLLGFLASVSLAFDQPARQALIPSLVARADLRKAIALHSVVFTGGAFLGPAITGLLAPAIGIGGVFLINAASYAFILIALGLLRVAPYRPPAPQSVWRSTVEGFRYITRHELILVVISLSAMASLFARSYQQLTPVFARDILSADITGLGWLMSAPGLGALSGAFIVATVSRLPRNGVLAGAALSGYLATLTVFALSQSFVLSVVVLVAVGLFNTVFSASVRTMLQMATPQAFHGRVMSLNTITFIGFSPLGTLFIGALAEPLGVSLAVLVGVLVVVLVFGYVWATRGVLRRAE